MPPPMLKGGAKNYENGYRRSKSTGYLLSPILSRKTLLVWISNPAFPQMVREVKLHTMGGVARFYIKFKKWLQVKNILLSFPLPKEQNNVTIVLPKLISYSNGSLGEVKVNGGEKWDFIWNRENGYKRSKTRGFDRFCPIHGKIVTSGHFKPNLRSNGQGAEVRDKGETQMVI